jgi:hypothetical protein
MPEVQEAESGTAPHVDPMLPPVSAQLVPMQQRFGRGRVCGEHVKPGAHDPVESQRHPWVPTMHVPGEPVAGLPLLLPLLLPPLLPLVVPLLPPVLPPLELCEPSVRPPSPDAASLPPAPESALKIDAPDPL